MVLGLAHREEAGVVTGVEEDAAPERPVGLQLRPAATGARIAFVVAFPCEIDSRTTVDFGVSVVQVAAGLLTGPLAVVTFALLSSRHNRADISATSGPA